jgi:hypothetical protein
MATNELLTPWFVFKFLGRGSMHGAVDVYVLWTRGRGGLARRRGGHVAGCGWFGDSA